MKRIVLTAVFLLVSVDAYAQQSLTDQMNAMRSVQDQNEANERAAQEAQQLETNRVMREKKAAQKIQEQRRADEQKIIAAQAEQRQAEGIALNKQKEVSALADKKRDQDYQDQLRALDVQEKSLKIQAEKARVTRANEYIDQELKGQEAQTDVVKSQADANRDLSSGTKTLLEKTGEAEVKSQSGLFK